MMYQFTPDNIRAEDMSRIPLNERKKMAIKELRKFKADNDTSEKTKNEIDKVIKELEGEDEKMRI